MKKILSLLFVFIIGLSFINIPVNAEGDDAPEVTWIDGPGIVQLDDELASVQLPEHYLYANGDDAKKIMEYFGNIVTDLEVGIIFPEKQDWFMLFEYDPVGYVEDNDANDMDADALLESIIDGTNEDNKERKKVGIAPLNIIGWDEKPHYDERTNNLVWSIVLESEGERFINYNTRLLGRHGITSVTLVADKQQLHAMKNDIDKIMDSFAYAEGKRYGDFVEGKDKVAEYGLAALIAGGVASKLGIFAKILLVFKKVWYILIIGIGAFYKKIKNLFVKDKPNPYQDDYNNFNE